MLNLDRLTDLHLAALIRRRAQLGAACDRPIIISAGLPRPRNYPAWAYPFRASSHFIYLVGLSIPGAHIVIEGGASTLYAPAWGTDYALWHGAPPSVDALASAVGCEVRPLGELSARVAGGAGWATVAPVDRAGVEALEALLGRGVGAEEEDGPLIDALIAARSVHDDAALLELREAAANGAAAFAVGMACTRVGDLEARVRASMIAELTGRCVEPSFSPIVSTHGEVLHNETSHHVMEDGALLLVDFGAESAGGWASDVTRAWPVSGRFSATQRALYEVVCAAQQSAIEAVVPGARYLDVHMSACRALTAALVDLGILVGDVDALVADGVHALFFPHGVGHLLGLDVHDMEDLGDRAGYGPGRSRSAQFGLGYLRLDRDLVPGMAVTIEPGFYNVPAIFSDPALAKLAAGRVDFGVLERFADVRGIRVEDDVLVTETGAEVLTSMIPKSVEAVEAAVGA